jgi:hypothetical protein
MSRERAEHLDEIEVEGDVTSEELLRAVTRAFGLPASREEASQSGPTTIVVRLAHHRGSFPRCVSLELVGTGARPRDRAQARLDLARALDRRILVSDEDSNPTRRIAIEASGATYFVDLDLEALERGYVEIARAHSTRATPNARLVRLGLAHLADDPEALRAELERRVALDEIHAREVEHEMDEIRRRLGVRAHPVDHTGAEPPIVTEPIATAAVPDRIGPADVVPPAAPPRSPAAAPSPSPAAPALREYPRGRKSSTLLVATRTPGACRACRHANQGTADMSEGHVFCQIDDGVKALDRACDVARPLPRTQAALAGDPSAWATYHFYEPYDGANGTWGRLQDVRLMAEDADEGIRRGLRADVPFIEAIAPDPA